MRRQHRLISHTLSAELNNLDTVLVLPSEALQLNRLSQNRKELFKILAFLIVTEYVLLRKLEKEGVATI